MTTVWSHILVTKATQHTVQQLTAMYSYHPICRDVKVLKSI